MPLVARVAASASPSSDPTEVMRAARLRRSSDIARVRTEGRAIRRNAFVVRVRRGDGAAVRVAVVAPGSVGRAVSRNRARRRVREAFRHALAPISLSAGADMLVTVRREAGRADFRALAADAASAVREAVG